MNSRNSWMHRWPMSFRFSRRLFCSFSSSWSSLLQASPTRRHPLGITHPASPTWCPLPNITHPASLTQHLPLGVIHPTSPTRRHPPSITQLMSTTQHCPQGITHPVSHPPNVTDPPAVTQTWCHPPDVPPPIRIHPPITHTMSPPDVIHTMSPTNPTSPSVCYPPTHHHPPDLIHPPSVTQQMSRLVTLETGTPSVPRLPTQGDKIIHKLKAPLQASILEQRLVIILSIINVLWYGPMIVNYNNYLHVSWVCEHVCVNYICAQQIIRIIHIYNNTMYY